MYFVMVKVSSSDWPELYGPFEDEKSADNWFAELQRKAGSNVICAEISEPFKP